MSDKMNDLLETIRASSSFDDTYNAAVKLRELGDEKAIEPILDRLDEEQDPPWLREILIEALYCSFPSSGYPSSRAADLLLKIFSSELEHQEVRAKAGLALGYVGGKQVVEILIKTLESGKHDLAHACITALGNIGNPKAVDILIETVKAGEFLLPQVAAEALGKIGPSASKAIPILQYLEKRGNEAEKRYAREAIVKIQGK